MSREIPILPGFLSFFGRPIDFLFAGRMLLQ